MITPPKTCCGCSACAAICPVHAIWMTEDHRGFYTPIVDAETCIECGLCSKTCPELSTDGFSSKPISAFALKIKSEKDRSDSTSGGAFTVLSDRILALGGVVFGTVYDESFKAKIVSAQNAEQRNRMRGSKYVESDVGDSYRECSEALKKNIPVLFSGTPCQIAGLVKYLLNANVSREHLFTCQVVCHGTPSPLVFRDHLNNIQARRKRKITDYYHRPKIWGWHEHNEMACYDGGKRESQTKLSQNHKDLFYLGYSLRESCFSCKYAGKPGYADFSIGDFWGVEHLAPEMDDNKGTSILLINSEKGQKLLSAIPEEQFTAKAIDVDDALKYNHIHPSRKPEDYEQFWDDYKDMSFSQIAEKYARDKMPDNLVYIGKKWLRRIMVKLHIMGY